MTYQDGLAIAIVAGCIAYLVREIRQAIRSGGNCGCAKGCGTKTPDVIQIGPPNNG